MIFDPASCKEDDDRSQNEAVTVVVRSESKPHTMRCKQRLGKTDPEGDAEKRAEADDGVLNAGLSARHHHHGISVRVGEKRPGSSCLARVRVSGTSTVAISRAGARWPKTRASVVGIWQRGSHASLSMSMSRHRPSRDGAGSY
eukprot:1780944-Rhodomonas_salina.7